MKYDITNFIYEAVRAFKTAVKNLSLSKKDVEDVMCNNAKKLYGVRF